MGKQKDSTFGVVVRDLYSPELYKRSQGKIARQVTFFVLAIWVVLGAMRLSAYLEGHDPAQRYIPSVILVLAGLWLSFRAVNIPRFADFLIATEAEMNKVTLPTKAELLRGSLVVLITIFALALILFGYDLFWKLLLQVTGIVA